MRTPGRPAPSSQDLVQHLEARRLLAYTLDTGFGDSGAATYQAPDGSPASLSAIAAAPAGKLWAAGIVESQGSARTFLARMDADGSIDDSFSPLTLDTGATVRRIVPLDSGALALVGDDLIARVTSAGKLDTQLRGTGLMQFAGSQSIAVEPGGAFFVAGTTGITKYGSDGNRISGWGNAGTIDLNTGASSSLFEATSEPRMLVRTMSNGRAMVAIDGVDESGLGQAALVRISAAGTIDSNFSQDGVAPFTTLGANSLADMIVLSDTQTLVLLSGEFGGNSLLAFRGSGTPRAALGVEPGAGLPPLELRAGGAALDQAVALIEQPGKRPLVVGGFSDAIDQPTYAAALRLNGDFTLDTAFAIDGDGVAAGLGSSAPGDSPALARAAAATDDAIYLLQHTEAGGQIVRLADQGASIPVIRDGAKVLVRGTDASERIAITADKRLRIGVGGERYATPLPEQLIVEAGAGDDEIVIDTSVAPSLGMTVSAGAGDDRVLSLAGASSDPHRFYAGDGDDDIRTGVARSVVFGEPGRDTIFGSTESDALFGGDGNDFIAGGLGDDYLEGNAGNDILDGSAGNDRIIGHSGADLLLGGKGDDTLLGYAGPDTLRGGEGADYLDAGPDNDSLLARDGLPDTLFGGSGDDDAEIDPALDVIDGIDALL